MVKNMGRDRIGAIFIVSLYEHLSAGREENEKDVMTRNRLDAQCLRKGDAIFYEDILCYAAQCWIATF